MERRDRALNDVINVGVITLRGPIAKLVDRLAGVNAPGELMNRQIGPLPWAVNGEIPQSHDAHLVKMRIGCATKFPSNLCRPVWTDCLGQMLLLGKWHGL